MLKTNVVVIAGRLGREAETRTVNENLSVTTFSIANDSSYKKDGEWVNVTNWIPVKMFNVFDGYCSRLTKGAEVVVTGSLEQENWTAQNGEKKSRLVLKGQRVEFPSQDKREEEPTAKPPRTPQPQDDDLPF